MYTIIRVSEIVGEGLSPAVGKQWLVMIQSYTSDLFPDSIVQDTDADKWKIRFVDPQKKVNE